MTVAKTIRTYAYSVAADDVEGQCDIELAGVETEGLEAWTLAFEASGLPSERTGTLVAAIDRFLSVADVPVELAAALDHEAGYPAWLFATTGS